MNILKILLILVTLFLSFNAYGQSITWQIVMNNLYGSFNKSQQCSDGGYIAVGNDKILPENKTKIYLVKFNKLGDTLWVKRHDLNVNENYEGNWIIETNDKGFIIGGNKFGPQYGNFGYLLKTDSLGNIKWDKIFYGNNIVQVNCVKQAPDNGYILTLRTIDYGTNDIRVIRTDSSGNTIWDKTIINNLSTEFAREILISNSCFYIIGYRGLMQSADLMLIKFNYQGDTLWTKYYGGNNLDVGFSIDKTQNNYLILGGYSRSFNSQNHDESYIVKVDSNGTLEWQKTFSTFLGENTFSIRNLFNKGFVFCGITNIDNISTDKAFIRQIDTSGNLINEVFYQKGDQSNSFESIELTNDNGFVVSGVAVYAGQIPKAYIVKTDSLGNSPIGINVSGKNKPNDIELFQNFPNPFNSYTKIIIKIAKPGYIQIKLFNLIGKEITEFLNKKIITGEYEINFDAELYNLTTGIYFYRLIYKNENKLTQISKKLIYIK